MPTTSAVRATSRTGTARQHLESFPFGEAFVEENTAAGGQDYRFTGKILDAETGLYYFGARYYDPITSVWQSVDPMAEKRVGFSPYNYVQNNPLNRIDPTGNLDEEMCSIPKKDDFFADFNGGKQPVLDLEDGIGFDLKNMEQAPENDWMEPTNKLNDIAGDGAEIVEEIAGKAKIGSNLKIYPNGWGGGSPAKIKTTSLSKLGKGIGIGTDIIGTGVDAVGVMNFYKNGENSPNSVKPSDTATNMFVRGLGYLIDLPWMIVFGTTDAHAPGLSDPPHKK